MSDDLIRRSDAIEATWQEPTYTDPLNVLTEVRDRIRALPSADRPQGEWIDDGFAHRCCICGKQGVGIEYYNYCPNCGARMKGADDE